MKIIKLLSAIKNIDQIYEGVKNKIFRSDDVEKVANERWLICQQCISLDLTGKKCAAPGTQPCCADCGCSLGFKLRALSSSCPLGQWNAIFSNELEEQFKKQTGYKE